MATRTKIEAVCDARLRGFDRFVRRRMTEWDVPGCVVGVAKGRRTVYVRAYGLRDIARREPVTERTLFYTASLGKTFTSLLAAILVGEGKVEWDRPIRDYLPSFRMYDDLATKRATLRDFLSQRTGLRKHDRMCANSSMSCAEVLKKLRHLQPTRDFRSTFQYSNLNYVVAGAVLEKVTGETWEELVRGRLLEPAGMTATHFVTDELPHDGTIATGYEMTEAGNQPFLRGFRRTWSLARMHGPFNPSGAFFSDIGDMCRYVQLHMHGGAVGKRTIVGGPDLQQTHTPHMLWPGISFPPKLLDAFYGMGWVIQPYRGHRCVRSGGNGYGFGMNAAFFPDTSLGVVVMTNQFHNVMANIIARNIFDRMLGLSQASWNRRSLRGREWRKARSARASRPSPKGRRTSPPRPLQDYMGRYRHPAYGTLEVTLRGKRLHLVHNQFPYQVAHRDGDVFSISLPIDYENQASFSVDDTDRVVSVAIPFAPGVDPIVFRRMSPRRTSTTGRSPQRRGCRVSA